MAESRIDDYRAVLAALDDWTGYLAANSGLPGPRANLSLVAAAGEEADLAQAELLVGSDDEYALVCGLVALGRLLGGGDDRHVALLHARAADERWRVREGVAMALQRSGDDDPDRAFSIAEAWAADPDPLVRRAAVATVCEPRLLRDRPYAIRALDLVEQVTADLAALPADARRRPPVRTLRQALGYGWSVAIAACPDVGLARFERLAAQTDPDVAWIVRENRRKKRLQRLVDHGSSDA